jgi:hypothetical protein
MRADALEKGGQSSVNAIHPDVHDALIQRERQGGGQTTLGPSWGSSMMEFLFGKPEDSLTASLQDSGRGGPDLSGVSEFLFGKPEDSLTASTPDNWK